MTAQKILLITSAVINNDRGEILFLQRSKSGTFQKYWQLPEGKIEENEKPEEAIKREIKEEISQDIKRAELVSVVYNELEVKNVKYLVVRLVYMVSIHSNDIKLSDEHSNFKWFEKKNILKKDLLPGIRKLIKQIFKKEFDSKILKV